MRSSRLAVMCLVLLASCVALAQTAPPIVAVFRIEDKGAGLDDKTLDQLTSYLEAAMGEGNVFRIVPQTAIKRALVEKKQESYQECYDLKCQIELGRELAAEKSLSTTILRIDDRCTVTAALYDLKTQVTDATARPEVGCKLKELQDGLDRAAATLKSYHGGGTGGAGFQEGRIGGTQDNWKVGSGKQVIIEFKSRPESVLVMVDGKVACEKTPCKRAIPEGLHEVSMHSERYQERRERRALAKGEVVDWEMRPNFGWLTVSSEPAGLDVLVNGDKVGQTPLARKELAPGGYEVLVSSPCHVEAGERVVIALGEEKEVSVRLTERQAAVEVSAKDKDGNDLEAEVLVDGAKLGETPDTFKVSICARTLEVRHPEQGSKQVALSLTEREVKPVAVVLEPAPVAPVEIPRPADQGGQPAQPEVPAAPIVRTLYLGFKLDVTFDVSAELRDTGTWGNAIFDIGTGMRSELTFDVKVMDLLFMGVSLGILYGKADSENYSDDLALFDLAARMGVLLNLTDSVDLTVTLGLGASMLMAEISGAAMLGNPAALTPWKFDSGYAAINMSVGMGVNWFFMDELGLSFEVGAYFDVAPVANNGVNFDFGPLIFLGVGVLYGL